MAATNIGSLVMLKLATILVVGETSTSVSAAQTMIELSNKTSGNDAAFAAGRITRTISVSSLASTDPTASTYGFKAALEAQETRAVVAFSLTQYTSAAGSSAESGMTIVSGNCLISNVTWDVPDNDKMTFSLDLQVTGHMTVGTN